MTEGTFSMEEDSFATSVGRIHGHIAAGETYQVNFTMKLRFLLEGAAEGLYLSIRDNQPVPFGAFIRHDGRHILSASPELFLRREGRSLAARPMKGTLRRGRDGEEDRTQAEVLRRDAKNRAENIMIVDLLRNDLGRICRPGSVETEDLFRVERYDTLLQMTSTVTGELSGDPSFREMLEATFPCGSVTGAPKISTMKIIADLERHPRGVYCGAIGFLGPGRKAVLSVPIRTAVLKGGNGEMGVGSGIVADSNPQAEYHECLLKARFLTHRRPALGLIETFRWEEALGFGHLEAHLARMDRSARFFGIPFCLAAAAARMEEMVPSFGSGPLLVRLLLSRDGSHDVSTRSLEPPRDLPVPVSLSSRTVDSGDPYLSHKTTRREAYDMELHRARAEGLFEILFTNERGELTEGSFTNLFVKRRGVLLTPPLTSGVLPGILRQRLLETGDASVVEQVLFPSDLESADGILVGNDARGLMAAILHRDSNGHSLGGDENIE